MTEESSQRDRVGELAESFVARFRAGERPSIDEYAAKYPELADELRQLLPALVLLEQHGSCDGNDEGANRVDALRPAPREIGEFTIIREIGRGGMGVVYEAVQQSLGRHVAIKVFSSASLLNPVHLERFQLEARSAGRLHHSHIVPVFGVGEHQGLHYYAMQFIPGQSLDQVIHALRKIRQPNGAGGESSASSELAEALSRGILSGSFETPDGQSLLAAESSSGEALPGSDSSRAMQTPLGVDSTLRSEFSNGSSGRPFYRSVARVGLQVAEALTYAHGEGILHRDIKPSNLLLDAKGNTWVTDFGLVKAEGNQTLTETGDLVGTLRYMAPERLDGWSDPRSDIYGLGAALYELITLRTFLGDGSRAQLLESVRHAQPHAPSKFDPTVPRDLETIVLKAVAKEPGSRYHTAAEMAEDFRLFLADRPILARRSTVGERFVRWCRRNPAVASLCVAVTVTLVAGTIASTWQAVRARRAEQLAESRFETEQQARADADQARVAETDQRKAAEENFQKARATVDEYFTLVSENTLFDVPGLETLRKDLLESALEFYQAASLERSDDPMALADVAVTQLRVSQVYLTLARVENSVAALRKSLDNVEQLLREHPNASDAHVRLAGAWNGRRSVKTVVGIPGDIFAIMQTLLRVEKTWGGLVERYPSVPAFRRDLAAYEGLIGETWDVAGNSQKAEAAFRKSREMLKTLVEEDPTNGRYQSELSHSTLNVVRMLQRSRGKLDEGIALVNEVLPMCEALVAESPENLVYCEDLRSCHGRLAGLFEGKKRTQDAERHMRISMELGERILRRAPGFRPFQNGWLGSNSFLLRMTEYSNPAAIEELLESRIRMLDMLIAYQEDDDLIRVELIEALHRRGQRLKTNLQRSSEIEALNRRLANLVAELAKAKSDARFSDPQFREELSWELTHLVERTDYLEPATRKHLIEIAMASHAALAAEQPDKPAHLEQTGFLHLCFGWLLRVQKEEQKNAIAHFEQAVQVFQDLSTSKFKQNHSVYRGRMADALIHLRLTYDWGGLPQEGLTTARRTVAAYQALVADYPKNDEFRQKMASETAGLAGRLDRSGQSAEAETLLHKLIAMVPQSLDAHQQFANLLVKQGRIEEASAAVQVASELTSTDALANNSFAWLLATCEHAQIRNPNLAVKLSEKAVELEPKSAQYLNTLGVAQYYVGSLEGAIASLEKAESLVPESSLAYNGFFLAMAHWQLAHQDEARKWFDRSVEWMEKLQLKNAELVRFRAEAEQLLGIVKSPESHRPSG